MKLRLRSLETKQTHKIEVSNTCNLQQLKEIIIFQLFPSSSSSSSSSACTDSHRSLLLSLNKKEELRGSSPDESLESLGITSGDLIYFTQNPYAFSSESLDLSNAQLEKSVNTQTVESNIFHEVSVPSAEISDLMNAHVKEVSVIGNPRNCIEELGKTQIIESGENDKFIGSSAQTSEMIDTHEGNSSKLSDANEEIPIDGMEVDDKCKDQGNYKFSVPNFLKKVFVKEVGNSAVNCGNHKLLVFAVHAVLLESGFVAYDPVLRRKVEGFHLSEEWPSLAFGMTLHYTLPEVSESEVVETVVLKFQTLGKFVKIYGFLPNKGFEVHQVCLDEPGLLPALSFVWKMSDHTGDLVEFDSSRKLFPNHEIFEFWRIVKDGLSYPLLIDLCEKTGLAPPSCFMCLPTELKLKILESLPAVGVARVECVCLELRFVASNNELWKMKYEEEFGNGAPSQSECRWKEKFCVTWEIKKKRKRASYCKPYQWRDPFWFRPSFPSRRDPNPLGSPFVVGGDYDRFPASGLPQHPARRVFRRMNCDLGGLGL
ncbi:putative F-box protein At1g23770 [Amaranthus tricolor]|uniref:putative F-box protein At1g23770 n=1 Tax=Amaranthus tricolor TaxID=29722 RepID=UPI002587F09C|nr:putative F-box protein At1g23770 [Amaranthus tricolor]